MRSLLWMGSALSAAALTMMGGAVVLGSSGMRAESDRAAVEGQMLAAKAPRPIVAVEAYAGWATCGVGSVLFADGVREEVVVFRVNGAWELRRVPAGAVASEVVSEKKCRKLAEERDRKSADAAA